MSGPKQNTKRPKSQTWQSSIQHSSGAIGHQMAYRSPKASMPTAPVPAQDVRRGEVLLAEHVAMDEVHEVEDDLPLLDGDIAWLLKLNPLLCR